MGMRITSDPAEIEKIFNEFAEQAKCKNNKDLYYDVAGLLTTADYNTQIENLQLDAFEKELVSRLMEINFLSKEN